jgi:hypothetical protein
MVAGINKTSTRLRAGGADESATAGEVGLRSGDLPPHNEIERLFRRLKGYRRVFSRLTS